MTIRWIFGRILCCGILETQDYSMIRRRVVRTLKFCSGILITYQEAGKSCSPLSDLVASTFSYKKIPGLTTP